MKAMKAYTVSVFHPEGVYAFKNERTCLAYITPSVGSDMGDFVIGQVSLWGRVIEHQGGYRAQYAYPRCFCSAYGHVTHGDILALARTYGVEVNPEANRGD
jgi:hypothetical protein